MGIKKALRREAIALLEEEVSAREALDPQFFNSLKAASVKAALELGIDPKVAKALFRHA